MTHHAAGLARLARRTHSPEVLAQIREDYTCADLPPRERALLDYAARLTTAPGDMTESHVASLREVGLSDRDVLDANLTVAYFAYANRVADGLGVRLEPHHDE